MTSRPPSGDGASIWIIGDRLTRTTARRWASEQGKSRLAVRIASAAELDALTRAVADSGAWLISCNSTAILSPGLLDIFDDKAINIHPGRLPDFAGLHAVQWAIRLGEATTASTAHFMTATIDAGDVIYDVEVPLEREDTGLSAWVRCQRAQMSLLTRILADIAEGHEMPRSPQDLSRRRMFRAADALGDDFPPDLEALATERWVRAANYLPLSSPTYHPTLRLDEPGLVLAVDSVVPRSAEPGSPPPATAALMDSDQLVVGCANNTAVTVDRARLIHHDEPLSPRWSRVVERLQPNR
jgi:methionyl-tRNA formyltransferase